MSDQAAEYQFLTVSNVDKTLIFMENIFPGQWGDDPVVPLPGLGGIIDALRWGPGKPGLVNTGLVFGCGPQIKRCAAKTAEYSMAQHHRTARERVDPRRRCVGPVTVSNNGGNDY